MTLDHVGEAFVGLELAIYRGALMASSSLPWPGKQVSKNQHGEH